MFFMRFFVESFYACQVLSNPPICRSFVAYFHTTLWMVRAKLFQIVGPIFVPRILQLLGLTFYSLISFRQNYNFDMLAMIWYEIVSWFLKIYKDLKRLAAQEPLIVYIFTSICAKQFYVSNMQKQVKIRNQQTNIHH